MTPEMLEMLTMLEVKPSALTAAVPLSSWGRKAMDMKKPAVTLVWNVSAHCCGWEFMKCSEMDFASFISGSPFSSKRVLSSRAMPAALTSSWIPFGSFSDISSARRLTSSLSLTSPGILRTSVSLVASLEMFLNHSRSDATRTRLVLLDNLVKRLFAASGNVYFCSVCNECLCDHETDSAASSCYDGSDLCAVEQAGRFELLVGVGRHGACNGISWLGGWRGSKGELLCDGWSGLVELTEHVEGRAFVVGQDK